MLVQNHIQLPDKAISRCYGLLQNHRMPCPAVLLTRSLTGDSVIILFLDLPSIIRNARYGGRLTLKVLYGLKQGIKKLLGVFLFKARKCHPEICFA